MQLLMKVRRKAINTCAHVGIGAQANIPIIKRSKEIAERKGYAKVRIYNKPNELISALKNREIEAAVRGRLNAKSILYELKTQFNLKYVCRVALLATSSGKEFLLAPVGIDEGITIKQKLELMTLGYKLLNRFGIEPRIGILSGGRLEDFGRNKHVDKTILNGNKLVALAKTNKLFAKPYGILIENAIRECNFIIVPNGITGNLMFRTLYFLGGGRAIGAPIVNLKRIFIDTSRAKNEYIDAIALASALTQASKTKV